MIQCEHISVQMHMFLYCFSIPLHEHIDLFNQTLKLRYSVCFQLLTIMTHRQYFQSAAMSNSQWHHLCWLEFNTHEAKVQH